MQVVQCWNNQKRVIRSRADLENFKAMYGIDEAITKEY